MSKIRTFSSPVDWNCLEQLLTKLPRTIDRSGAVRLSIEKFLESVTKTPYVSMDNFVSAITKPTLEADPKTWSALLKGMDVKEVRELQKLMQKRLNIVNDEVYKRTL